MRWKPTFQRPRRRHAPRPRSGDELELTIDSLAFGGAGVARLDGYVVFVQGAIPGDRVKAVVAQVQARLRRGPAIEILEPSPDRIAPAADHPGAPWQVLPYERQLEVKQAQVDDALRRIGKLDGYELETDRPGRRARGATATSSSTRSAPTAAGRLVCGFHAPGRWNEIVEIDRLPARLRGRQRGAGSGRSVVPRPGTDARTTAAAARACCATSSSGRAAAAASSRSGS